MTMSAKSKHRRRRSLHREQRGCCADCQQEIAEKELQLHHLTPKSLGGSDALYNLKGLCPCCHQAWHR